MAHYIGFTIFRSGGDIRDVMSVGKLIRKGDGPQEVERMINTDQVRCEKMLTLLDFENAVLDLFEDNRIPVQDAKIVLWTILTAHILISDFYNF